MEDQRRDNRIARRDEHIPQSEGRGNNTHPLPSENPQSHELDSYTEACRDLEKQLKAQINLIKRHLGAVGMSHDKARSIIPRTFFGFFSYGQMIMLIQA